MNIKTWIKYEESYLPPRCRKLRYRECEDHIDVKLREVKIEEMQLAFEDNSYEGAELLYDGINYLTVWKLVGDPKYSMLECCANCKKFAFLLKNNRYQDIELFCFATGYFISGIFKDKRKIKHYSPGGKILECKYESLISELLGN